MNAVTFKVVIPMTTHFEEECAFSSNLVQTEHNEQFADDVEGNDVYKSDFPFEMHVGDKVEYIMALGGDNTYIRFAKTKGISMKGRDGEWYTHHFCGIHIPMGIHTIRALLEIDKGGSV